MSKDAKGAFNGADESKFDHDKNGAPGGSAKAVPTVAEAEQGVPDEPVLSEAELRAKIVAEIEAQKAADEQAAREKRIAEEAAHAVAGQVQCRVLPKGDGLIFKGTHEPDSLGEKFPTYKRGDVFWIARDIAEAQEDAGRVEIVG